MDSFQEMEQDTANDTYYEEVFLKEDDAKADSDILSKYQYVTGCRMTIAKVEEPRKVTVSGYEMAVLRALAIYRILDSSQITRCVNDHLEEDSGKETYEKEIKNLTQGGHIYKYTYNDDAKQQINDSLCLYVLSQKGASCLKRKGVKILYKVIPDYMHYETTTLLETAALNDWHIRIQHDYKNDIRECRYNYHVKVLRNRHAVIPSYFSFFNPSWVAKGDFTLLSIPCPKIASVDVHGAFLNQLMMVNAYANENDLTHPVIMLIADSFKQAADTAKAVASYTTLEGILCMYAITTFTAAGKPLSRVYKITVREDKAESYRYWIRNLTSAD